MGLTLKNVFIGMIVSIFMMLLLFDFATGWASNLGVGVTSPDILATQREVNSSQSVLVAKSTDEAGVIEGSNIYSGADIGIISAEPYKNLKSSFALTKVAMNVTTSLARFGYVPSIVVQLGIVVLLLTIAFLVLSAIFRVKV